ncbi:MAG: YdeI/OmpD-associated family protein [Bacteroidia bacterium]|nr:YdeI/OmpD-associated family protein [Bacteroidia bacterium]
MNRIGVDHYLAEGCGRCPLGGTPDCKVHAWQPELRALRQIVLGCGLTEEVKWGVPCYTFQGSNILIVSAFKEYASLSFFKGALLADPQGILAKPGEHSQAARIVRITRVQDLAELEPVLRAYIFEAIEVERMGLQVDFKAKHELALPEELQQRLDADPVLKAAFGALTPGRQRGYVLYFSAPKQSKTRTARIEACVQRILDGKGMQDR